MTMSAMSKKGDLPIYTRRKSDHETPDPTLSDSLTGLPTRVAFDARLFESLMNAQQTGKSVAIVFLDLDGLKTVNHTFGHAMGDLLLQQVAIRLKDCVTQRSMLARLGGDEFLILQEIEQAAEADSLAHKIIESLHHPFVCED